MDSSRTIFEAEAGTGEAGSAAKVAGSSLERLLRVIDLFTSDRPIWTADEIGEVLHVSRATQYRYLKALVNSGLLASSGNGHYRLGPRFVVIDRQIRMSDPLLRHGSPAMLRAVNEIGHAQLLCTYFGNQVICVHQESADARIKSSMERGRPFPLFRGSPSRTILAWMSTAELKNLMLAHSSEIQRENLGDNWHEFLQWAKDVRARGYYVGRGEIDRSLMGVGVPVMGRNGLIGSLTTIMPLRKLTDEALEKIVIVTQNASQEISDHLDAE